jgi:hypothetical protein
MVGVVNPVANQTLAAYKRAAAAITEEAGSPVSAFGGILASNSSSTTSAGSAAKAKVSIGILLGALVLTL